MAPIWAPLRIHRNGARANSMPRSSCLCSFAAPPSMRAQAIWRSGQALRGTFFFHAAPADRNPWSTMPENNHCPTLFRCASLHPGSFKSSLKATAARPRAARGFGRWRTGTRTKPRSHKGASCFSLWRDVRGSVDGRTASGSWRRRMRWNAAALPRPLVASWLCARPSFCRASLRETRSVIAPPGSAAISPPPATAPDTGR